MFTFTKSCLALAVALVGAGLQAEDFTSLTQVAKTTWPEKNHIGVICDYRFSSQQIDDLACAVGPGSRITVVDVRTLDQTPTAARILANRSTDYMVLLPGDRIVRDGSMGGTMAVHCLARLGVPSVGTTPRALVQGAVFATGDGTQGELLVTDRLKGTVDVILPQGIRFSQKASLPLFQGKAQISVVGAE